MGCGVPKREFWSSSVVPQHFRRLKMPYAHHARKIQAARCLRMLMLVATYSFLAGVDLRGADLDSQCDFTPPIVHSATEYAQGATTHDPARRLTTLESCFERFNKAECEVHFRFEQHELAQLYDSLGFPPSVPPAWCHWELEGDVVPQVRGSSCDAQAPGLSESLI